MKNPFKKEVLSYKGEESTTPYQKAKQEWDSRIGAASAQANNWRVIAILSLFAVVLLLVALVVSISSHKDQIYIAEVTKEGRVVNVAPLLVRYKPTAAQKEYFVAKFIELTRSIPLDPVLARKNWLTAYTFLTGQSGETLNNYFRKANPTSLLGKKTVTIKIVDVNPITPSTLHVDWTETTINANGQEEVKKDYSGVFTIIVKQPKKQANILKNPLGIYIVDFNITPKQPEA